MNNESRKSPISKAARPPGRKSRPVTPPPLAAPAPKDGKPSAAPSLPQGTFAGRERTRALLLAVLVACASLPYLNILANGFVFDDDKQLVHNPYIRSFHYLGEIFTTHVWSFMVAAPTNYYRPMMTLGYLFCYKLFGLKAYGFHLVSLLLHVLVVWLLFALTERLTGDRVCAFAAAMLFALHPVHTESVAWIAAVTDLELSLFYLLAFWFYSDPAKPGGRRSRLNLAAMLGAFLLALLSKEQAMTLPALATVYEHFYREDHAQTTAWRKLSRYGPLWLAGAMYILYRVHFLGTLAPRDRFAHVTPLQTVLSAVALVGQYVGKLLWPVRLCGYYVFHPSQSPFDAAVLAGLLALAALAAGFVFCWRSRERQTRLAGYGILWFLATLAPTLNAHWVGLNVFTERYLYLPSVGVAWLAGVAASKLWGWTAARPAQRRALAAAGIVLGTFCLARIVVRNRDWRNDLAFYTQTIALQPDAYPVSINLGMAYWDQGAYEKAESVWQGVLAQAPGNSDALTNLGLAAAQRKQYAQAGEYFQRSLQARPTNPEAHLDLAKTYRIMGQAGLAESEIQAALRLSPLDYQIALEYGRLLFEEGRWQEAVDQLRASVRDEPNTPAYDFLGAISLRQGDLRQAEHNFRAALALDEADSNAHFGLGFVCKSSGRSAEALNQYASGLKDDPGNRQALAAIQELRQQGVN